MLHARDNLEPNAPAARPRRPHCKRWVFQELRPTYRLSPSRAYVIVFRQRAKVSQPLIDIANLRILAVFPRIWFEYAFELLSELAGSHYACSAGSHDERKMA